MNVSCDKALLTEGLNLVGRAVSSRTTLPILECILLTADESGLRLTANDLEMCIDSAPIAAEVEQPGSVALDAKLFTEIVRKMPGDYVQIETNSQYFTECRSGRAKFKIMGLPGEEFPAMPEAELEAANQMRCVLPCPVLKDMIRQTIFSVALDETKPILTGELVQCKENILSVVAVDGFRISYRRHTLPEDAARESVMKAVIPAKALNELSRVLPSEGEDELSFYFTGKRVVFETRMFTFISRLLEGDFIRYDQIFNEDFATIVTVERLPLLNGLERSVLIARDSKKSPVKLEIKEDSIIITSNSEMGHAYDEVYCEIDGANLEIAFNPRYLIEALRAIEDEKTVLKFTTALSPCIIRGLNTDDYKYLVLPLRLRS